MNLGLHRRTRGPYCHFCIECLDFCSDSFQYVKEMMQRHAICSTKYAIVFLCNVRLPVLPQHGFSSSGSGSSGFSHSENSGSRKAASLNCGKYAFFKLFETWTLFVHFEVRLWGNMVFEDPPSQFPPVWYCVYLIYIPQSCIWLNYIDFRTPEVFQSQERLFLQHCDGLLCIFGKNFNFGWKQWYKSMDIFAVIKSVHLWFFVFVRNGCKFQVVPKSQIWFLTLLSEERGIFWSHLAKLELYQKIRWDIVTVWLANRRCCDCRENFLLDTVVLMLSARV